MKFEVSSYFFLYFLFIVGFCTLIFLLIRKVVRFFVEMKISLQKIERKLKQLEERR